MKSPSSTQAEILRAVKYLTKARGFCPTIREIAAHTGRSSTNAVHEILKRLERDGFIARAAKSGRTITIIDKGTK